ncbi:hypothetical protein JCM3766R1_003732 [Sporobolomyces carnicolor]
MKASLALLVLSCASMTIATSGHGSVLRDQHNGMRLIKRQAQQDTTTGSAATSQSPAQASPSPSTAATSSNRNPLDSLTDALQSSSQSSATSDAASEPATTEQETSTPVAPPSSASSSQSSSSVAPSSASRVATSVASTSASSAATGAQSTVVSIVTPSADSSASDASETSTASSSASAVADKDKKSDSSSSGGIGHGTLIAIIVVASCVAGVAAIWTIIRKTKFSPSKRFESKLEPIDFVPEVPEYGSRNHHDRSQSQLSGTVGGGGMYDRGYEASLARSDSKASLRGQGMAMSESGGGLASIPYQQSSSYAQQAYYGEGAYHSSPQLGYPHEQPTYYPALQRGPSSSSSLQHQAAGLGRMNTTGGGSIAYDYAAQARSQSRGPVGGHHQYY